jgi:hypothetical protein
MLGSVAACVARPHPDDAITLVWHGGAIVALALGCMSAARFALQRREPPLPTRL